MQPDLTAKQEQFLVYLQKQIERTGGAPSLRKAAADLKISHAAVAQFVRILEKKGILKRDGRYSRDIYLLDKRGFKAASQRGREVAGHRENQCGSAALRPAGMGRDSRGGQRHLSRAKPLRLKSKGRLHAQCRDASG